MMSFPKVSRLTICILTLLACFYFAGGKAYSQADKPAAVETAAPPAAPAPPPASPSIPDFETKLIASTPLGSLWILLLAGVVTGAIGGLGHRLSLMDEAPFADLSWSQLEQKPAFLGDILLGVIGAFAFNYFLKTDTFLGFWSIALLGGYGGKALLNGLITKFQLSAAQAALKKTSDDKDELTKTLKKVHDAVNTAPAALTTTAQVSGQTADPRLDLITQALNEHKFQV
jgi:hypothetical protein